MKHSMLLLSALMGMMLSHAAPVSDDFVDPMANFSIVDIEWIVPISPDRNDTVIGTIQDVANHLAMVDPEGFAAVNKSIEEAVAAPPPPSRHSTVSYSSSDDPGMYDPTDYACQVYKENAFGIRIRNGIEYLRKVKGTPGMGPGPMACGRVSCSWNSAIWWCNQNPYDFVLDTYGRIADGAQDLTSDCTFIQNDGAIGNFNGNIVFGGNWWVVVRKNSC